MRLFHRLVYGAAVAFSLLTATAKAGSSEIDPNFIVFGYLQNETVLPTLRWNALTHVADTFIEFNSSGGLSSSLSTRNPATKAGGAAEAAGVKFIMCLNSFDDGAGGAIETVMTSATLRQTLITNIVNQITADGYCAGLNIDIEFDWGPDVRDGFAQFLTALRAQLPAKYELSVYVNAFYDDTQWNAPNLAANCDYVLYSGYDWGSGNTPHAITDQNNNITQMTNWMNAGIPPEKFVYTMSTYGRRWTGTSQYDVAGSSFVSRGFTDGLFETTLQTAFGGPYTNNYVTGDEGAWYTYNDGTNNYTVTWDNLQSLEYKMRTALSMQGATYAGRRLKGVAFWSLNWLNEDTSFDPVSGLGGTSTGGTSANGLYNRTYPHVYQLMQRLFSRPGVTRQVFDKQEALNPRWAGFGTGERSPDNLNVSNASSSRAIEAAPAGGPAGSTNAMRLNFAFSSTPGKAFFRHEVLKSGTTSAGILDTHATDAKFDRNNAVGAQVYAPSAYPGITVRVVVMDSLRQLEASPAFTVASGWQTLSWDLTDSAAGNVTGLTTAEPAFTNGDGVINTAGGGADDISFVGFLVERNGGGSAASGSVYFDELFHEPRTPGNRSYVINEFRYNDAAREFVEIHGPAGAFPANLQLRFYNSATGAVLSTVALGGQSIPASGLFTVGDGTVANVNLIPAGWGSTNNVPNTAPSALQLIDPVAGVVYDSVTYRAMGGLDDLVRQGTFGVTGEGYGWLGETGNSAKAPSLGRYPDGADTNVNEKDFSLMPASPGTANGGTVTNASGASYDFTTVPANAFQTYQALTAGPVAAGMTTSGTVGNVGRVVDTSGGGVQAYFGDAALGGPSGYNVTGMLYLPPASDPKQAIAVGICGRQGSSFFSWSPEGSGYDSGYWLIYEHGTVLLNDGQPSHPQQFQFVMARNNNMASTRTLALGTNKSLGDLGVTPGTEGVWVPFRLSINPSASDPNGRLLAEINGRTVYKGAIPADGPTSGAFQVGYREDNAGTVTARMGTWIDSVAINNSTVPVSVSAFSVE